MDEILFEYEHKNRLNVDELILILTEVSNLGYGNEDISCNWEYKISGVVVDKDVTNKILVDIH
ncbi:hypothetical protein ACFW0C_08950 [Aerococcus sp. NPDC058936]|uniref:hypothetical protein n=1 Tax=Aerococcus sp. NPDC058936 TaxID=3346674 RepID=UPI00366C6545